MRDYATYANSPKGLEARARARAKWIAKRRAENIKLQHATTTIQSLITNWARS